MKIHEIKKGEVAELLALMVKMTKEKNPETDLEYFSLMMSMVSCLCATVVFRCVHQRSWDTVLEKFTTQTLEHMHNQVKADSRVDSVD
jgi:antitoxin component of MazEF toxin-antitoxin module